MDLVLIKNLDLKQGDTVVTANGTFTVLSEHADTVKILWLESLRTACLWMCDSVYGPVEVLRL